MSAADCEFLGLGRTALKSLRNSSSTTPSPTKTCLRRVRTAPRAEVSLEPVARPTRSHSSTAALTMRWRTGRNRFDQGTLADRQSEDLPNSPRNSSKLITYVRGTYSTSVAVYSPTGEPRSEPSGGEWATIIAPRGGQSASGSGTKQPECGC